MVGRYFDVAPKYFNNDRLYLDEFQNEYVFMGYQTTYLITSIGSKRVQKKICIFYCVFILKMSFQHKGHWNYLIKKIGIK